MQDGDLGGFIKAQGGMLMSEDMIMLKFVQICLAVHYVHEKVPLKSLGNAYSERFRSLLDIVMLWIVDGCRA